MTYDQAFADAVRRAARGDSDDLAAQLASRGELGAGELELLQQLLDGELDRPEGRPKGARIHFAERRQAVLKYRANRECGMQEKAAAYDAAKANGISVSLLRVWQKEFCEAEQKMQVMGLINWQLKGW